MCLNVRQPCCSFCWTSMYADLGFTKHAAAATLTAAALLTRCRCQVGCGVSLLRQAPPLGLCSGRCPIRLVPSVHCVLWCPLCTSDDWVRMPKVETCSADSTCRSAAPPGPKPPVCWLILFSVIAHKAVLWKSATVADHHVIVTSPQVQTGHSCRCMRWHIMYAHVCELWVCVRC